MVFWATVFGPSCFANGNERDPNLPLISGYPLRMANMARWYVYTDLLTVPLQVPAPFAAPQNPCAPAHEAPAHKAPVHKASAHKRAPAKTPGPHPQPRAKH